MCTLMFWAMFGVIFGMIFEVTCYNVLGVVPDDVWGGPCFGQGWSKFGPMFEAMFGQIFWVVFCL